MISPMPKPMIFTLKAASRYYFEVDGIRYVGDNVENRKSTMVSGICQYDLPCLSMTVDKWQNLLLFAIFE